MGICNSGKFFLISSAFIICLLAQGCKKDNPVAALSTNRVVLFDDEYANPGYSIFSPQILAGNDRLFMIYPHGGEGGSLNDDNIQTFYIVSDNRGQLIKMGSIPAPSFALKALVRPDGTFHVVVGDYDKSDKLLIYHFDNNGGYTGKDSVLLKNGFTFNQVMVNHLGNFVLRNWNLNTPNQVYQFQEIDLKGKIVWSKIFNFNTNQPPVIPVDGGFIFTTNNAADSLITIVKYDAKFDTAWIKRYKFKPGFKFGYTFQPLPFKNKHLIRLTEYGVPGVVNPIVRRFNLFISNNGDSLSLKPQSGPLSNPNGHSIVRLTNGNIFYTARYKNKSEYDMYLNANEMFSRMEVIDENLNVVRDQLIQGQTIDYMVAACKTSDGQIACFGVQQIFNTSKFKPELILLNE